MKAPSKKSIETRCLDFWSLCVRTRDRKCRVCGSDQALQGHHIRSRTHKATYLDIENGITLCSRCHCIQKFNPERFQDTIRDTTGNDEYQRVRVKSQREFKPTMPWLRDMKDTLKQTLAILENEMGRLE